MADPHTADLVQQMERVGETLQYAELAAAAADQAIAALQLTPGPVPHSPLRTRLAHARTSVAGVIAHLRSAHP